MENGNAKLVSRSKRINFLCSSCPFNHSSCISLSLTLVVCVYGCVCVWMCVCGSVFIFLSSSLLTFFRFFLASFKMNLWLLRYPAECSIPCPVSSPQHRRLSLPPKKLILCAFLLIKRKLFLGLVASETADRRRLRSCSYKYEANSLSLAMD